MKTALVSDDANYRLYYGMMRYHLGWMSSELEPMAGRAGKRVRPLVCLLVCDAAGGDWELAVPAAAAIELLHNFSLIHDDIEDDSTTRRGRESLWTLWGIPQAINAGDSMFAIALDLLARLVDRGVAPDTTAEATSVLTRACVELTKGQHLDMWFEHQENVDVDQYLRMISGKTAALISATTEIGAIIAGSSWERRERYAAFGRNLGMAFQVYDDILGVWGDEAAVGKSAASDIVNRKKTLPVLYGLAQSPELRDLYAEPAIDLVRAVEALDAAGAKEYTLAAAQRYSDEAVAHLEAAAPAGLAGEALRALTAELVRRQS